MTVDTSVAPGQVSQDSLPKPLGKVNIIVSKGEFIGGGATGIVERLKSGDVVKTAWTGRPSESDCKREIAVEAQNFVTKNRQSIVPAQRKQWAIEATEAIEFLHSHGVIQADVGPHNFLLDANLSLRICDFGGSSLDGSRAMAIAGVRYRLPMPATHPVPPACAKEDLFALGSTIYFLATGYEPFHELGDDEDEVQKRFRDGQFSDLADVPFGDIIGLCWKQEVEPARTVLELLQRDLQY